LIWIERILLVAGVLGVGSWVVQGALSRHHEAIASRALDRMLAGNTAVASGREAKVIGRIEIPRLGLNALIGEGTGSKTLGYAVGHIRGTAYPGQAGNVCIAGHRDTYFRKLSRVRADDRVRIRTVDGTFLYRIRSVDVMRPDRTDVLHPTSQPELTLITCYPFDAIGPAPRRFVVRAVEVKSLDQGDVHSAGFAP
jgi:sortase A